MFDAGEFQRLAKSIAADFDYQFEAAHRTVAGRAYYSVFHLAMAWLSARGWRPKGKRQMHKQVLEGLKKKDPHVANLFKSLQDLRVACDYALDSAVDKLDADRSVRLSDNLRQRLGT